MRGGFSLLFRQLAQGKYPACFCFRNREGLSPGKCCGGQQRKPSETFLFLHWGRWGREGEGEKLGWGAGRGRIALQCALNKCVHLDLISSNALFSDPICLSQGKFGERFPSYCESIILQIYSRQGSHYNRCQRRNLSCRGRVGGTANHEKEGQRQQAMHTKPWPPPQT